METLEHRWFLEEKHTYFEDNQNYPSKKFSFLNFIPRLRILIRVINVIGLSEAKAERDERQKP